MMKAMAAHCKCMAKAHEAAADCHQSLSECFKAEQAEGLHKGMKDMHADLQSCHKSMSESYAKMGEACKKSDSGDMVKAIVSAVMANVDARFGDVVMPTGVHKVLRMEDPLAPAPGSSLVPRAGGMSVPVAADKIDPAFQHLFQE